MSLCNNRCVTTPEEGLNCLVFDTQIAADAAAAIYNADCGTCECGCDRWGSPTQRPDGKWWIFANPNVTSGIEGTLTYAEEDYSDNMETSE